MQSSMLTRPSLEELTCANCGQPSLNVVSDRAPREAVLLLGLRALSFPAVFVKLCTGLEVLKGVIWST